jgi:diguanylate cyclase (GGDEF)-like protein
MTNAQMQTAQAPRREPAASTGPAAKLLLVDDIEDNRVVLRRRFQRRGFEVDEAESGARALELIGRYDYDLVLLDVRMPDMDGVEALKRLRLTHPADLLPVIMCTANNASEDVVVALEAGANDYVAKPVDFAVALARVQSQVERKRNNAKLKEAYAALNALNGDLERRVEERTRDLANTNEKLLLEVLRRQQADARTQYLAYHDALTGLPNRVTFRAACQDALAAAKSTNMSAAVFFLDLDGFKNINDTLGHSAGDVLLKAVATRLRERLPTRLTLARLGGDEFGVLLAACPSVGAAIGVATDVVEALAEPFQIDAHSVSIAASVGVSLSSGGEENIDEVLKSADLAMYRAKEDSRNGMGGGAYRLFDPSMDEEAQNALQLKMEMRAALKNGEFLLHFQPIVSVTTGRIVAFEALIRWQHPTRGLIGPVNFIPLAESTRYIVPIGEWVIREACRVAATWPDDIKVAVNLSPVQFQRSDITPVVIDALATSGIAPERLELEITESVLLDKSDKHVRTLEALREIGATISMDDFGTGFSSLSYLRTFPFDKIKIDQSFIQSLGDDKRSLDIITAIAGLGRSFGMKTVAEGVETALQYAAIAEQGCTEVQGRYYAMPMTPEDVTDLLRSQPKAE